MQLRKYVKGVINYLRLKSFNRHDFRWNQHLERLQCLKGFLENQFGFKPLKNKEKVDQVSDVISVIMGAAGSTSLLIDLKENNIETTNVKKDVNIVIKESEKVHRLVLIGEDKCTKKVKSTIEYVSNESKWSKYTSRRGLEPIDIIIVKDLSEFKKLSDSSKTFHLIVCSSVDSDNSNALYCLPAPKEQVKLPDTPSPTPDILTQPPDTSSSTSDIPTPPPDLSTLLPAMSIPAPDLSTPSADISTPAPDISTPTPTPDLSTPPLDLSTPLPAMSIPPPDLSTQSPTKSYPTPAISTPPPDISTPPPDKSTPLSEIATQPPDISDPPPDRSSPSPDISTPPSDISTQQPNNSTQQLQKLSELQSIAKTSIIFVREEKITDRQLINCSLELLQHEKLKPYGPDIPIITCPNENFKNDWETLAMFVFTTGLLFRSVFGTVKYKSFFKKKCKQ